MRSATCKIYLRLISLLLDLSVPPMVRARGLLSWSLQSGNELNSLSGGSDKELIQLVDRRLDGSDHILQPLSAAAREFSQVGVIISSDDHRLFSMTMFRDLVSIEVIWVLLVALFLDGINGSWW